MIEREMQELLWRYPDRLLDEPLKPVQWEASSAVGRADLIFEDKHGRLLIVEVKRGTLPRGAIDQLLDYFGMVKQRFPDKPVEMMVVANVIPPERRLTCESRYIECRDISEKKFRELASDVGYTFTSESTEQRTPHFVSAKAVDQNHSHQLQSKRNTSWSFNRAIVSTPDTADFLSRCDPAGREFFSALFEAQKSHSSTNITWKHESGFSLQFQFRSVGFAPIVWGFPSINREGKSTRQRLEFPFDFASRYGVPEDFINEFGSSLSAVIPFAGGGKRPSIPVGPFNSSLSQKVIDTIFEFALKASAL